MTTIRIPTARSLSAQLARKVRHAWLSFVERDCTRRAAVELENAQQALDNVLYYHRQVALARAAREEAEQR